MLKSLGKIYFQYIARKNTKENTSFAYHCDLHPARFKPCNHEVQHVLKALGPVNISQVGGPLGFGAGRWFHQVEVTPRFLWVFLESHSGRESFLAKQQLQGCFDFEWSSILVKHVPLCYANRRVWKLVECRLSALDLKETCETMKAMLSIVPTSVFEEISKKMKQLLQTTTRKYVQLTASVFFFHSPLCSFFFKTVLFKICDPTKRCAPSWNLCGEPEDAFRTRVMAGCAG